MIYLRLFFSFLFSTVVLVALAASVAATPVHLQVVEQLNLIDEIEIAATPFHLVVEAPGRIWFTAPNDNVIGLLIFTDTAHYQVLTYTVPTVASKPYDIALANGKVWFTEFAGNKLAQLNPTTGSFQEFPLPSLNSGPMGLDVAPDGSIWTVESNTEKLAHLNLSTQKIEEFAYSRSVFMPVIFGRDETETLATSSPVTETVNIGFNDIAIGSDYTIWLTMPERNRMVYFSIGRHEFYDIATKPFVKPSAIVVDEGNVPWVIAQAISSTTPDQIGRYLPGTLSLWHWYSLPDGGNNPASLFYRATATARELWFTGSATASAGRITTALNRVLLSRQKAVLNLDLPSQPQGISADSNGDIWIALTNRPVIVRWQQPYFHNLYLPTIARSN